MAEEFSDLEYTERIARLIVKYHRNELTESEALELRVWCAQSTRNQDFFDMLSDPDYVRTHIKGLPDLRSLKKKGWAKIVSAIGEEDAAGWQAPVRRISGRISRVARYYLAAASLAGLLLAGVWFYTVGSHAKKNTNTPSPVVTNFKNDIAPGKDRAVLTLADGSSVVLDSTGSGTIARQAGAEIVKVAKGSLAYNATAESSGSLAYNTLSTPAAAQFQLTLPDGSKVWLNNASSLRYPVAFVGKERMVELSGEAYFEITKNSNQPFKVKVGNMLVDVLGTSFNVAAYAEEATIKTTLLSGGVKISGGNNTTELKPGEQAQLTEKGDLRTIGDIDIDGVVAWKNGLFHFERADIRTVMRILARWYDVEVVYEGPLTDRLFGGDIQRNLNLSEVLTILARNKVNFSLEGRKLTVKP